MNDLRPFRGLRFHEAVTGPMGDVVCPPYDVISACEQAALHDRNPFNVVRLELGFQTPEDDSSDNRYSRAAETLDRWLAEGVLRAEEDLAFYLYEHRFVYEGKTLLRRGLLGRLRLSPWEEGVVLPHEETMAKPKADRLQLMRATACNLSPVFLLFDDPTGTALEMMGGVAARPADVTADLRDGELHRLWVVQGTRQQQLAAALREPQLYVADGHHRYETALSYRDERRAADPTLGDGAAACNFVMVMLVDARDPGLVVLPTHRVVRGIDPVALAGLDGALASVFDVEAVESGGGVLGTAEGLLRRMRERGEEGTALGLYRQGDSGAMVLRLRGGGLRPPRVETLGMPTDPSAMPRDSSRAVGSPPSRPVLDVDVLHGRVLAPLMGIGQDQLKAGTHVTYTRDAAEALSAVDRGEAQAAFLLNPTRVDQVLETARAGGKMPQKSTFFYPKPVTGLVINRLT